MTKRILICFLPLLALACVITENISASPVTSLGRKVYSPKIENSPGCQVETGFMNGTVNLRACGGTDCPVIAILHEDEVLTQTSSDPINGWFPVRKSSGLQGWVNSKYCKGK